MNNTDCSINKRRDKKGKKAVKAIGVALCFVFIVFLSLYLWQHLKVEKVKALYMDRDYIKAYDVMQGVIDRSSLGDLPDKINMLGTLHLNYNNAMRTLKLDEGEGMAGLLETLIMSIQESDKAAEYEITDEMIQVRTNIVLQLRVMNVGVYGALTSVLKRDKNAFSPITDPRKLQKIFANTHNLVSSDEIEKIKKEKETIQ